MWSTGPQTNERGETFAILSCTTLTAVLSIILSGLGKKGSVGLSEIQRKSIVVDRTTNRRKRKRNIYIYIFFFLCTATYLVL